MLTGFHLQDSLRKLKSSVDKIYSQINIPKSSNFCLSSFGILQSLKFDAIRSLNANIFEENSSRVSFLSYTNFCLFENYKC